MCLLLLSFIYVHFICYIVKAILFLCCCFASSKTSSLPLFTNIKTYFFLLNANLLQNYLNIYIYIQRENSILPHLALNSMINSILLLYLYMLSIEGVASTLLLYLHKSSVDDATAHNFLLLPLVGAKRHQLSYLECRCRYGIFYW